MVAFGSDRRLQRRRSIEQGIKLNLGVTDIPTDAIRSGRSDGVVQEMFAHSRRPLNIFSVSGQDPKTCSGRDGATGCH